MSNKKIPVIRSSGNVFADLELPNPEECLFKAELVYQINKLIEKRRLKQQEAALLLNVDQPKISALKRGRLSGFSVERLFKFLTILNQDIEIVIKPHHQSKNKSISHIHVTYTHV